MRIIKIGIFYNNELETIARKIFEHFTQDFGAECISISSFGPHVRGKGFSIDTYKITNNIRGLKFDICIYPKEDLLSDLELQRILTVNIFSKRIEYDSEGELSYG